MFTVSVPRRGFVVFLPAMVTVVVVLGFIRFSPPKGIRCFSTRHTVAVLGPIHKGGVSVPRRGFVVFLPTGASPESPRAI